MLDFEQKAIAVRKNMDRLRALREAKEAREASSQAMLPDNPRKKPKWALSRQRQHLRTQPWSGFLVGQQ